jgi:hypothetical protein
MNIFNLLAVLQLILQNQTKTFGLVLEKHGLEIVFPWEMAFTSRQMEVRTGRTWDYLNLVVIIVDPKNSDIVWVGVLGALWGDSDERGVYKTTDGGTTWNKVLFCR